MIAPRPTAAFEPHLVLLLVGVDDSRAVSIKAEPPFGVGLPRYYVLVTWATNVALWNYLRRGVPATWSASEGTRL